MSSSSFTVAINAVGHPGGVAPHFHVQYHSPSDAQWLSYQAFTDHAEAEDCMQMLDEKGVQARLVSHLVYPTAA